MRPRQLLNQAYGRLERMAPLRLRRILHWLHGPAARPVRVPVAILCIIGSFFSFLPVLGLELFPVGLLLLAHEVPALRRPAARLTMWLLDQVERVRDYWRQFRASRQPQWVQRLR